MGFRWNSAHSFTLCVCYLPEFPAADLQWRDHFTKEETRRGLAASRLLCTWVTKQGPGQGPGFSTVFHCPRPPVAGGATGTLRPHACFSSAPSPRFTTMSYSFRVTQEG